MLPTRGVRANVKCARKSVELLGIGWRDGNLFIGLRGVSDRSVTKSTFSGRIAPFAPSLPFNRIE